MDFKKWEKCLVTSDSIPCPKAIDGKEVEFICSFRTSIGATWGVVELEDAPFVVRDLCLRRISERDRLKSVIKDAIGKTPWATVDELADGLLSCYNMEPKE